MVSTFYLSRVRIDFISFYYQQVEHIHRRRSCHVDNYEYWFCGAYLDHNNKEYSESEHK